MATKKTWIEKFNEKKEPQIKRIDNKFADMPAGSLMLIATPKIIAEYIQQIDYGKQIDIKTMRKDLALEHQAEYTCPLTTGIFLRIVAEAQFEKLQQGLPIEKITPFWRVIDPKSPLAKKLTFGTDFIVKQLTNEKN